MDTKESENLNDSQETSLTIGAEGLMTATVLSTVLMKMLSKLFNAVLIIETNDTCKNLISQICLIIRFNSRNTTSRTLSSCMQYSY